MRSMAVIISIMTAIGIGNCELYWSMDIYSPDYFSCQLGIDPFATDGFDPDIETLSIIVPWFLCGYFRCDDPVIPPGTAGLMTDYRHFEYTIAWAFIISWESDSAEAIIVYCSADSIPYYGATMSVDTIEDMTTSIIIDSLYAISISTYPDTLYFLFQSYYWFRFFHISGIVVDSADGEPIENALVTVQTDYFYPSPGIYTDTTDSMGNYSLFSPEYYTLSITAMAEGYRTNTIPCHPLIADTSINVVLSEATGINEKNINSTNFMSVFPNPFNSSCAITAPAGAEIEIYDLRGNVVGRLGGAPITDNRLPMTEYIWSPDASIPSGIYLVKARTADGRTTAKRIVYMQ